jgi:hypothetical protein
MDEAILEAREGLRRDPGSRRLRFNLGLMLQDRQQHATNPAPTTQPAPAPALVRPAGAK